MTSKNEYNNNEWHTVVFSRQQNKGKLIIDGEDEQLAEANGGTRPMAVQAPYSYGGVSPDSMEDVNVNIGMGKGKLFTGCIRDIQMNGRSLGEPSQTVGVLPCSEQIEQGTFFGKGGGYVKVSFLYFEIFLLSKSLTETNFWCLASRSFQSWYRSYDSI